MKKNTVEQMNVREQKFFLCLLSDFLAKRKTIIKNDINWKYITEYSKIHGVDGIVFYQCREFFAKNPELESLNEYYSERYSKTIFRSIQLDQLRSQIKQIFISNNIQFIAFKGATIKDLYPIPSLRTMGDIDILVHDYDVKKCLAAFENNRCIIDNPGNQEYIIEKNGYRLELHDSLLFQNNVNSKELVSFFKNCWSESVQQKNGCEYLFTPEFHFIYLLVHIRVHLMQGGVGFRQFMDLVVMLDHYDLNQDYINTQLKKIGLEKFGRVCIELCRRLFNIAIDSFQNCIDDAFYEDILGHLFSDGLFGKDNDKRQLNTRVNDLYSGSYQKVGMIKMIQQRCFPAYGTMKKIPRYSYLDNKPFLLPFAWFHRGCYNIAKKNIFVATKWVVGREITDEMIDERNSYLRKWGLHIEE